MAIVKNISVNEILVPENDPGMKDASVVANQISGLGLLDVPLTESGVRALLRAQPVIVTKRKGKSEGYSIRSGLLSLKLAKRILGQDAIVPVLDLTGHQGWDTYREIEGLACQGVFMAAFAGSEPHLLYASITRLKVSARKQLTGVGTVGGILLRLGMRPKSLEKTLAKKKQLSLFKEEGFSDL